MKFLTLLSVYVALVLLLLTTIGVASLDFHGPWKPIAGVSFAAIKAALIALFFMDLFYRNGLVRLFAGAGLFCLFLSALLTAADYLTR